MFDQLVSGLVLVIGGRDYITPKRRQGLYLVDKHYIYCQWGDYKLLTVDERNSAPVDMINIPSFTGFHTCQVVSRISEPPTVPPFTSEPEKSIDALVGNFHTDLKTQLTDLKKHPNWTRKNPRKITGPYKASTGSRFWLPIFVSFLTCPSNDVCVEMFGECRVTRDLYYYEKTMRMICT